MAAIKYGSDLAEKDALIDALQARIRVLESNKESLWDAIGDWAAKEDRLEDACVASKALCEALLAHLGGVEFRDGPSWELESMAHKVLSMIPGDVA